MIIVGNYQLNGAIHMNQEIDAMAYEEYPQNDRLQTALEVWKAGYARVEKRYRLIKD